jgi:hypothetical protein
MAGDSTQLTAPKLEQQPDLVGNTWGQKSNVLDILKARPASPKLDCLPTDPFGDIDGQLLALKTNDQQKPRDTERAEMNENIERIRKENVPFGKQVVEIAKELGKDPERWKNPVDGSGKCNLFVEAVGRAAGAPLPWKEGCPPEAKDMIPAFLKYPESWQPAYHYSIGDTNQDFHKKYVPQDGDIAVWSTKDGQHVAIVEATQDKTGNILYAGAREWDHPTGFAHTTMDWMSGSTNYGPPTYVFRRKN